MGNLVLKRRRGESVVVGEEGAQVRVTVLAEHDNVLSLGFEDVQPGTKVPVWRSEVLEARAAQS